MSVTGTSQKLRRELKKVIGGDRPSAARLLFLANNARTEDLVAVAGQVRDRGHGNVMTYSPKVFLPLTQLCRDRCHYCTFAKAPGKLGPAYLSMETARDICREGAALGCHEALFTLGDKPELRYRAAREALADLGHESTLSYVRHAAEQVLRETGLLPHVNAGVMEEGDLKLLRGVSASQGLMLETTSRALCRRGGVHYASPDKDPVKRIGMLKAAGRLAIPMTSGMLVGIGETVADRIRTILVLRALDERYGHIQEVIVQNFKAKPNTAMAAAPEPDLDTLVRTIALARIALGPYMNIQAPPNLSPDALPELIRAGINDWGGISPLTPDHVNPEAPWPSLDHLKSAVATIGKVLVPRLTVYPAYVREADKWLDPSIRPAVLRLADGEGFAREDGWQSGVSLKLPGGPIPAGPFIKHGSNAIDKALDRVVNGAALGHGDIVSLFRARGDQVSAIAEVADSLRRERVGEDVSFVVTRNINYTNICKYHCQFCGFSRTRKSDGDPAYILGLDEIEERVHEAWLRGATETCLQGGIYPNFTGNTYLEICKAVRRAAPDIHIHAFSPLEISHGAETLGLSLRGYLEKLADAGLNSLPGTAAEILDDDVRSVICPDKVTTDEWLRVVETAHDLGIPTTATIMFGHVDRYEHQANHLMRIRDLQEKTGGITEFVPLPFVAPESPMFRKGRSRKGPTLREAVLMHAVARLVFNNLIDNIQVSWVKMGLEGSALCLKAGANDLGGTLMNESISRAAGAQHGQEFTPARMRQLIERQGRRPRQRTTLYGNVPQERLTAAMADQAECGGLPLIQRRTGSVRQMADQYQ